MLACIKYNSTGFVHVSLVLSRKIKIRPIFWSLSANTAAAAVHAPPLLLTGVHHQQLHHGVKFARNMAKNSQSTLDEVGVRRQRHILCVVNIH